MNNFYKIIGDVTEITVAMRPPAYIDEDIHTFSFTGPTGPVFFLFISLPACFFSSFGIGREGMMD